MCVLHADRSQVAKQVVDRPVVKASLGSNLLSTGSPRRKIRVQSAPPHIHEAKILRQETGLVQETVCLWQAGPSRMEFQLNAKCIHFILPIAANQLARLTRTVQQPIGVFSCVPWAALPEQRVFEHVVSSGLGAPSASLSFDLLACPSPPNRPA